MATELFIPKLGQTVEEVTLVKWLVTDGAKVAFGDALLEVETDKAVFPVESPAKGILHLGPFNEGDVVPVLTVVGVIGKEEDKYVAGKVSDGSGEEEAEAAASVAAPAPAAVSTAEPVREKIFASPRARKAARERGVDLAAVTPTGGEGTRVVEKDVLNYLSSSPKATPVAQKVASATGVDLREISGTGPGGRIMRGDVERVAASGAAPAVAQPLPQAEVLERIPLKGVRSIIAERMAASVHTSARVTLLMDVDATKFVAARERIKTRVEKDWGFAPGYNDLLAKIVASALRKFPYMNARITPDAIETLAHVNMGMAVDTERGLLVPVIRDADRKSLREFGADFRAMVERARQGRSLPDDLSGGTFTITNLGMYDIEGFTPVINLPEAAILGVGKIIPKPVVIGEEIVVRKMWTLSLVFDHRLVDGAPAARFMQYIKHVVEEPFLLIAE